MRKVKSFMILGLIVGVLLWGLPTALLAQDIYVVNIQEIVEKSVAGNAIRKNMEEEAGKRKARLEKMRQDVAALERKIQKQASLLSAEALQQKRDALYQKQKDLSRAVKDEQESLKRDSGKAVANLVQKIQTLLPKIAEEKGPAIVVEKDPRLVVYASSKYDLTAEVIERLNEKSVSF